MSFQVLQTLALRRLPVILDRVSTATARDIQAILLKAEQFGSVAEAEGVGGGLRPTTPLKGSNALESQAAASVSAETFRRFKKQIVRSKRKVKSRANRLFGLLPRVATGKLLASIKAIGGGAIREVVVGNEARQDIAIYQHFGTHKRGVVASLLAGKPKGTVPKLSASDQHIPPRPFFGVSARAVAEINIILEQEGQAFAREAASVGFPPVRFVAQF